MDFLLCKLNLHALSLDFKPKHVDFQFLTFATHMGKIEMVTQIQAKWNFLFQQSCRVVENQMQTTYITQMNGHSACSNILLGIFLGWSHLVEIEIMLILLRLAHDSTQLQVGN